jgi:uncharacterized protein (TIGR02996 family)
MTDAAFLQAIRDDPSDDTPRLIYADYLDDHGQADRAELIRVQCELARTRDRDRAVELRRRVRQLIIQHRTAWQGNLVRWAPDACFERGFVEHVALPAATFVADGPAILAEHPIHRVTLRDARGCIEDLAGCPTLAQLRGLDLRGNDLGNGGVAALALSPFLDALRKLALTRNGIGSIGVQALVTTGHLRHLETLGVKENGLGDGGVEVLAGSPNLPRLTSLDLSRNGITDRGARLLADSPCLEHLTSLRLAANHLTRTGIEALASSPHLYRRAVLDVAGNAVDNRTATKLRERFGSYLSF